MRYPVVTTVLAAVLGFAVAAPAQSSNPPSNQNQPDQEYNDPEAQPAPTPGQQPEKDYSDSGQLPTQPQPAQPQAPEPGVKDYDDSQSVPGWSEMAPGTQPSVQPSPPPAAQVPAAVPQEKPAPATAREEEMRQIAERYAPVIFQRMAGEVADHRFELPTNFDFDGDWIGNNNWAHAADPKYKIWSFVYYDVLETEDYYFLHYSLYHARDWSLAQGSYDSILDKLQDQYKQIFTKDARNEAEFNHENDLEGILVIVDKWRNNGPQVVAMETVAHNHLLRAIVDGVSDLTDTSGKRVRLPLESGHPVIYVESQKHGIHPYGGETSAQGDTIVVLRYGKSTEISQITGPTATYDLINQVKTFWKQAQATHEPNLTFGTVEDFGNRFCEVESARRPDCEIGVVGAAFRGDVARPNAANAPWAWFDLDDKDLPIGVWVFDPVVILQRHFGLYDLKEKYLYNPYLGIDVGSPVQQQTTHKDQPGTTGTPQSK